MKPPKYACRTCGRTAITMSLFRFCRWCGSIYREQESEPNVPRREVSEQLQTDLDALLARLIFIWGDTVEVRGVFNEIVSLYAKYAEVKADVRLSEEYVSN